jgi:hypothetical protein
MDIDARRASETRDRHLVRIRALIEHYHPGAQTVVLLPGGMGSQLDLSTAVLPANDDAAQTGWDTAWLSLRVLLNKSLEGLELSANGTDTGGHLAIANGEIRGLYSPYDATEKHLQDSGRNYIVFGFDWRRSLGEGAAHLEWFLTQLKNGVLDRYREDPLPKVTLLGHSQGGLVIKVFLHRLFPDDDTAKTAGAWFERVVMVGAPFYGTCNHMQRYYVGESPLGLLYSNRRVAELTATLPAPYVLMFPSRPTYESFGARAGLHRYPVLDETESAADPFDPAQAHRFPPWVNPKYIQAAARTGRVLARQLPAPLIPRVFNFRAVVENGTPHELIWSVQDGEAFDPTGHLAPVLGAKFGAGDGTVPSWSGRLVDVPDDQVADLEQASKHVTLLQHGETLATLDHLLDAGELPDRITESYRELLPPKAPDGSTQSLLVRAKSGALTADEVAHAPVAVFRNLFEEGRLC